MLGTPTVKSLRSFDFKRGAPRWVSEALQYVGVGVRWIGRCMLLCAVILKSKCLSQMSGRRFNH